jgi:hypothetical protein
MDGKIEQHVCIKFCVKLGKFSTENLEMLRETFGEHTSSRTAVFEWHSRFKACQVSVEDDECSGRPGASKTKENVKKILRNHHEDRCRTIHDLADTVGILTENFNISPSSQQCTRPHIPENHRVCG